jgi:hypothetical protein
MSNKQFSWTDELVKEFMIYYSEIDSVVDGVDPILKEAQKFKQDWEKRNAPIPEYEILSFKYKHCGGLIVDAKTIALKYALATPDLYSIHSVRRLSDGEVFALGDTVYHVDGLYPVTITEFYQPPSERGEMWFYWSSFKETVKNLDNFKKQDSLISPPPKPLFTTEDGWDIYETSNVMLYGANTDTWIPSRLHSALFKKENGWKWFSNEYNRDRYILMNKPLLSINEVMEAHKENEGFIALTSAITSLAKAKL